MKFREWLSWLVPLKYQNMKLVRGQNYILAVEHYRALDSTLAERQVLRAELRAVYADLGEAQAKLKLRVAANDCLEQRCEALKAKFEAACIVNHLQKQKQTSYEREVYAASMGGMILDNQEEIARIAMESKRAMKTILLADESLKSTLGTED
jgi:hypothetical protein